MQHVFCFICIVAALVSQARAQTTSRGERDPGTDSDPEGTIYIYGRSRPSRSSSDPSASSENVKKILSMREAERGRGSQRQPQNQGQATGSISQLMRDAIERASRVRRTSGSQRGPSSNLSADSANSDETADVSQQAVGVSFLELDSSNDEAAAGVDLSEQDSALMAEYEQIAKQLDELPDNPECSVQKAQLEQQLVEVFEKIQQQNLRVGYSPTGLKPPLQQANSKLLVNQQNGKELDLIERMGRFKEYNNEYYNEHYDSSERYRGVAQWDRFLTEEEFEQLKSTNPSIREQYERYLKFYAAPPKGFNVRGDACMGSQRGQFYAGGTLEDCARARNTIELRASAEEVALMPIQGALLGGGAFGANVARGYIAFEALNTSTQVYDACVKGSGSDCANVMAPIVLGTVVPGPNSPTPRRILGLPELGGNPKAVTGRNDFDVPIQQLESARGQRRSLTRAERQGAEEVLSDLAAARRGDKQSQTRIESRRPHVYESGEMAGWTSLDVLMGNPGALNQMRIFYRSVPNGIEWRIRQVH